MLPLTALYAAVAAVLGIFAYLAIKPADAARKTLVVTFMLLLGLGYISQVELLGRPKPTSLEFVKINEAEVLHYTFTEGVAIDVLLQWGDRPRLYSLPWDKNTAKQLQGARKQAGKRGKVIMRLPFEQSLEDRKQFHAIPQPKPPEKRPETPLYQEDRR